MSKYILNEWEIYDICYYHLSYFKSNSKKLIKKALHIII